MAAEPDPSRAPAEHTHTIDNRRAHALADLAATCTIHHDRIDALWIKGMLIRFPCGLHLYLEA